MTFRAKRLIIYTASNSPLNRGQAIEWLDKYLSKGWRDR